jgi:hypothetical protein
MFRIEVLVRISGKFDCKISCRSHRKILKESMSSVISDREVSKYLNIPTEIQDVELLDDISLYNIEPKNLINQIDTLMDKVDIYNLNSNQEYHKIALRDSVVHEKLFKRLLDHVTKNEQVNQDIVNLFARFNLTFSSSIDKICKLHSAKILEFEGKTRIFEDKLIEERQKLDRFNIELNTKNKEIEGFTLRSKLTRVQKEALQFFEDKFLGNSLILIFS